MNLKTIYPAGLGDRQTHRLISPYLKQNVLMAPISRLAIHHSESCYYRFAPLFVYFTSRSGIHSVLNGNNEVEMESLLTDVGRSIRGHHSSGGQQWNIQPPQEFSGDRKTPYQLSAREKKALEDLQFIADHHREEREEYQVSTSDNQ